MKLNKIKLGELVSIQQGFAFKSKNYVKESKYRLVTLGNFEVNGNKFKLNDKDAKYYDGEFPSEVVLKTGDLILPLTEQTPGLLGNSAFIPKNENYMYVLNQRVGKIICNSEVADKYYIHFLLNSKLVKKQLEAAAHGTRQRNISPEDIYDLTVFVPSLAEQRKIGSFLYKFEKKEVLNNAISKELESMAKTIYDYWFLQFEFPDKDGKPYKSNGGKMVWNDQLKQEIPEGWEVKYLSDIESNIVTGKTPSTKDKTNFGKDVPFICIGDIRNHSFINSTAISLSEKGANSQKKKFIPSGSLCVSCIATPGLIGFTTKDSQTNQQINTIVFNNIKNKYFLYFALFEYFNSNKNVKTGNTFSNMNKEEFSKIKIIYNKKLVDEYFNTVNSYFEKIKLCEFENEQLQSLRDFLLPMLMNGQVIIED